jgi:hypothetical protein
MICSLQADPMTMFQKQLFTLLGWILCAAPLWAGEGVQVTKTNGLVRVEIGGELFTEYHYKDVPRPFCYPLLGPGGVPLTRDWPMKESAGEEHDHPHHRSFWFAHGQVNGTDFWTEQKKFSKTVHQKFITTKSGDKFGVIKSSNVWVSHAGKPVCSDERTLKFYSQKNPRLIDFEIVLKASHGPVTFGDTKEGTFAVRVAETMRLKPNESNKAKPTGHIVLSTGVRDADTWGKRAAWCDYFGPVNGRICGIAIFDHPQNPRYPTWWHVRDYGLFAANPFGIHDFEQKPKGEGDLLLHRGQSVTFRYRLVLHEGSDVEAGIAGLFGEYANRK